MLCRGWYWFVVIAISQYMRDMGFFHHSFLSIGIRFDSIDDAPTLYDISNQLVNVYTVFIVMASTDSATDFLVPALDGFECMGFMLGRN